MDWTTERTSRASVAHVTQTRPSETYLGCDGVGDRVNLPYEVVLRVPIEDRTSLAIIRSTLVYGPSKPALIVSVNGIPGPITFGNVYAKLVAEWLEEARVAVSEQIAEELGSKADRLLDVHAAFDPPSGQVVFSCLFGDRDTAVMFKLAHG
jgi:hypothetical protein